MYVREGIGQIRLATGIEFVNDTESLIISWSLVSYFEKSLAQMEPKFLIS